jgi:protein TonB
MKLIFKTLVVFAIFIPILSKGQCDSLPNLHNDPWDSEGTFVESQPEFPGGDNARFTFLKENIKLPNIWPSDSIIGRVFIAFVVEENGEIKFPCIVRSLNPFLDSIALSAVRKMPRWIPAKQRGKPVKMFYTMPITFGIEQKKKK